MEEAKEQIKPFFRVFNTDLQGNKPIVQALQKVYGIGFSLANAICHELKIPKTKKAGLLTQNDAKNMESLLKDQNILPYWLLNKRNDIIVGMTRHLFGSELKFAVETEIKTLKRLRTYKGVRHSVGQPVRGQRTRSHFRHGRAVGVQKSKIAKVQAAAAGTKKEEKGKK